MYLKKIRLLGFKSFCDPQVLELNAPISAVVGPNGCGKSNIIDAVKCLTGQSKAREMRGDQISDLIFNGSDQRHPVGQAQVELVFDNKDQILKGSFAHYNEVAVKRVIGRDGQSSFYINQTRCRRRDVIDLFTGTGLGPQSYAIIEQGMIARFIEAKPAQVRAYIEEVAGISRYKERRKETLSQLESSRENLIRLSDIRGELRGHVAALSEQAAEALRYQELKQNLIRYRQQHTAYLYRQAQVQLEKATQQLELAQQNHQEKVLYLRQLHQNAASKEQAHEQAAAHLADLQKEQYQLQLLIEQKKAQWQQARQRRQFLEQDCQQWEAELKQIKDQIGQLNKDLSTTEQPCRALEGQEKELSQQLDSTKQARQSAAEQYQKSLLLWQESKDKAQSLGQKKAQQQLKLDHQKSELARLESSQLSAQEQVRILEKEASSFNLTELEKSAREKVEAARQAKQEHESHKEQEQELKKTIERARWQLEQLKKALAQADKEQQKAQSLLKARQLQVVPWLDFTKTSELGSVDYTATQQAHLSALATTALFHGTSLPPLERWTQTAERDCEYVFGTDKAPSYWRHFIPCSSLQEAQERQKSLASYEALLLPGGALVGPNWIRPRRQRSEPLIADLEEAARQASLEYERLNAEIAQCHISLEEALIAQQSLSKKTSILSAAVLATQVKSQEAEHALIRAQQRFTDLQQRASEKKQYLIQNTQQLERATSMIVTLDIELNELLNNSAAAGMQAESLQIKERADYQTLGESEKSYEEARGAYQTISSQLQRLKMQREQEEKQHQQLINKEAEVAQKLMQKKQQCEQSATPIERLEEEMSSDLTLKDMADRRLSEQQEQVRYLSKELELEHRAQKAAAGERDKAQATFIEAQMALEKQQIQQTHLNEQILDQGWTVEQLLDLECADSFDRVKKDMTACQKDFDAIGAVNLRAIAEHQQQLQRLQQLDIQCGDLEEATRQIEKALSELDTEMHTLFHETFTQLQKNFEELFPTLFGGGRAQLILEKVDNDEEPGVVIQAQPPGKKNATLSLLSGGEKALTAAALLFAFFQLNPAPFCLLDEIDAPLDDSNTARLGQMIAKLSDKTQFIIVTHSKVMMEFASSLYGVTMKEPGVSRLVSVTLDEALEVVGEEK